MQITKISVSKSKTFGVQSISGKTSYKKITIFAEAELADKDDVDMSYKLLSSFVDEQLLYEKDKKI